MAHKVSLIGSEYVTRYRVTEKYVGGSFRAMVASYKHKVSDPIIWTGVILDPTLEIGELLYIDSLEVTVKILSVARTTKSEMRYYTNHTTMLPDDEETERSRVEAQAELDLFNPVASEEKEPEQVTGLKRWFCK